MQNTRAMTADDLDQLKGEIGRKLNLILYERNKCIL